MQIHSYAEKYTCDDEDSWIVTIEAKVNNDVLFTFKPEYCGTAEDWNDLTIACEIEDMNNSLSDEGDCQISVNNKHVFFELSRHGNGYGGDVEIMVPKKLCIDAFKHIYQTMSKSKY
jgi:hypothetical protein